MSYFSIFFIALLAPFATSSQESPIVKETPFFASRHFSSIDIIKTIEEPFLIGLIAPFLPDLLLFEGKMNRSIDPINVLNKEVVQLLFGIFSVSAIILANLECLKAFLYRSKHATELGSLLTSQPHNCSYHLTITMGRDDCPRLLETEGVQAAHFSGTKTFENSDPRLLIDEAIIFVKAWTREHAKANEKIMVTLKPTLILKSGKSMNLKTQSLLWNERVGIERTLREIFLMGGDHTPHSTHHALGYSVLSAAIGYAAAFYIRTIK